VCLGNPYVCVDYNNWKDSSNTEKKDRDQPNYTPFPTGGCHLCKNDEKTVHHSVYAEEERREGSLRSREFIVYDKGQTYPEYIIYYQRNFSSDKQ
jgi:hypothetical protein